VNIDDKKKDCFMIGPSSKLQERMALNMGGSFPEFVSNVINVDEAIRAYKEAKRRKVVVASFGSTRRYRTVYHHSPTYPPHQQHQRP
jgi:hypothetical protein